MDILKQAQSLECGLGDPRDPTQLFSFAQRVAEDEAQQYPADAFSALNQLNLHRHYVPVSLGGELRSFDQLGALLRVVARRDLTVAIGHAISFIGAMSVWLAGNDGQRQALADAMLSGECVSLALTEQGSGSDLLNMDTTAELVGEAYHLVGEKWLINGISHNRFVTVYARTADGGPRGFTLFLVDKDAIPGGYRVLPKIATLGVRGADISGICLDAVLPAEACVGVEGSGFETILKALQLSRTLCGALSLGALDTALETTLRFAQNRTVYGKAVTALPQCQKLLSEAWAELLIADSLTGLALRGLQTVPDQASVHSAVVKYLVPTLAEQAIQKLSVVHGARYYLRDNHEAGIFQKMYRDNLLISLFDGSTQVNLFSLSHQLRALIIHKIPADPPTWVRRDVVLDNFACDGLALSSSGRDDLFASFDAGILAVHDWLNVETQIEAADWIKALLARLAQEKDALVDGVRQMSPSMQTNGDPQVFELARRYCVLVAVAGVLADWQLNRNLLVDTLAQSAVLAVVLQRLAAQLGDATLLPTSCYRDAFAALLAQRERNGDCGLYRRLPDGR